MRHGKGARGSGPRERMVPLINDAGATLRWCVEDVWAQFGNDHVPATLMRMFRDHDEKAAAAVVQAQG